MDPVMNWFIAWFVWRSSMISTRKPGERVKQTERELHQRNGDTMDDVSRALTQEQRADAIARHRMYTSWKSRLQELASTVCPTPAVDGGCDDRRR